MKYTEEEKQEKIQRIHFFTFLSLILITAFPFNWMLLFQAKKEITNNL